MNLRGKIRDVPDFPKKGIVFKDVTPLLLDPQSMRYSVKQMAEHFKDKKVDVVLGPESRGFIFGAIVAYELGAGFVPVRKKGKLPHKTVSETYEKEYGPDTIEVHEDAIRKGASVLIIDDLLATGGTVKAVKDLVEKMGGKIVGFGFLIELGFLKGREKIKGYEIFSLINYEEE